MMMIGLVLLVGCQKPKTTVEIVNQCERQRFIEMLKQRSVNFVLDDKGMIISDGPDRERLERIFDQYEEMAKQEVARGEYPCGS
jgi:hypothetical protein